MNLPGLSLLRERAAVRAFETQDPSFRDIVFYSEGAGDWPHIGPVIEALLGAHDRRLSFLSSDPADPGLRVEDANFHAFQIGTGTMRTILFARMDCRHFVMTLPDLDNLWLKRSVHPVHYIYLFHSVNSTHTSYRKGAFDAFDTILCVGPHHVDEIRKAEAFYGLPRKELIEHGSAKLDSVLAEVDRHRGEAVYEGKPHVLVAPTWGDSSLVERPVGRHLLDALIDAGHRTVLRLHPMTQRRRPQLVAGIERRYRDEPLFRLESDMNAVDSWMRSTVMISDWSGAAVEYAFALGKPVIYVDTPPKILNAEWDEIGAPSFEAMVRHRIGRVVDETEITTVPNMIARVSADDGTPAPSSAARDALIFNVGASSQVAAAYLISLGTAGEPERGGSA